MATRGNDPGEGYQPRRQWSNPSGLVNVKGILFFAANDGTNGVELWKSTGTLANTVMVKNIRAGAANSNPTYLTNVKGSLFPRQQRNLGL